jgi:membrane protein DedA with SNARE-associated domain
LIVMVVAAICALATATCIGYYAGRRAGSKPSTWKRRTSRVALGRLAISLLVLMTARRIRRRTIAPLALLRLGAARVRSY